MKKMKLNKLILTLLLILALTIPSYGEAEALDPLYKDEILNIIEENYVEKINKKDLKGKDLKDIFKDLDEHSNYYTEEEYTELMGNLDGDLVGIGVYIMEDNGYIKVIEPIKNSPAEKAGLLPGDIILSVNAKSIEGLKADEVTDLIKGEEGSKVKLRFKSGNITKVKDIERKHIVINPVQYQIFEDIGYIELDKFSNKSYKEMVNALNHMDQNNISKIILDLRDNPGGYLDQTIDIANLLIPAGSVVHISYKNRGTITYNSDLNEAKYDLVVLVNENSASASEILAGAIKDRKAGQVIGATTYGKGTVQEIIRLPKGDGIKLTTAEYFSPKMNKINGKGITPNISVENQPGEDTQLKTALELLLSPRE